MAISRLYYSLHEAAVVVIYFAGEAVDYEYDHLEARNVEPFLATVAGIIVWADHRQG